MIKKRIYVTSLITIILILVYSSFSALGQIASPTPSTIPSPTPTNPALKIEITKQQNPNLGYLVEFSLPPLVEKRINSVSHKKELDRQHSETTAKIIDHIAKKRGKSNIEIQSKIIKKSYKKIFNGVLLDITKNEADEIRNIQGVKRISQNKEVRALLSESVPLIEADKVWELDNSGKPCATTGKDCITGKGVKIAILDTGIDYTHPDLGNSIIEERSLERITDEPVILFIQEKYGINEDQTLSLDENRLAYFSRNKIFIYNFDTRETKEIKIAEGLDQVIRIAMKGNIILYAATDKDLNNPGIYYYALDTKLHHKVAETREIEIFRISNGKIVYTKLLEEDPPLQEMVVYDINTGEETIISEKNAQSEYQYSMPVVENNYVVYPTYNPMGACYENVIIYNIDSKEKKEIHPPDIGPIFDIKDNKILYIACSKDNFDSSWSTYYLYDINTGENIQLKTSNPSTGHIQGNLISAKVSVGVRLRITGWINDGRIEDEVLFLTKDVNADKIVIYEMAKQKYFLLNVLKYAGNFDSEGNKVCFMSIDFHIYCHDYNSDSVYELPKNIFNNKVRGGYDIINNDNDPFDDNGHGTHVAGIVAGNGVLFIDGKHPLKGVAPDAELYAYKVLSIDGSGSDANVIEGLERAIDPNDDDDFSDKADIISMSLGSYGNPDDEVSKAIDKVVDLGVVAVISAGNSGPEGRPDCRHDEDDGSQNSICSPGTARKAITVGATTNIPEVKITWGDGAGYANPGLEKDLFQCPSIDREVGNRCDELSVEMLSKINEVRSLAQSKGKKLIDREGEIAELGDFYITYSKDKPDKIGIFEIAYISNVLDETTSIGLRDFLTGEYSPYHIGSDGEEYLYFDTQFYYFKINLLKDAGVAGFSSRGPVIWQVVEEEQQSLMKPDIVAPGFRICSAMSSYLFGADCHPDQQHITFSGTSMAAPHVTGIAALLKQKNPNLGPEDIKNILKSTSVDLNLPENVQGSGRIRALESVFSFIRGDTNNDRRVDLSDAIFLLDYLFRGGAEPTCLDSADANDDGIIDVSDSVFTLLFLFRGDVSIPQPYPKDGWDLTDDLLGCAKSPPPFLDLESDLVAYYSFDNGDIKDSSGNGNNGFISLGKGSFVEGKQGKALNLDGMDDFAFIPPSASLDGMEELTISTWVKVDDLSSRGQVILTKGLIDDYSYVLDIDSQVYGKVGTVQGNIEAKTLLSEIGDETFHHVVLVYAGNALSLYVDGVRKDVVEHPLDGTIKATSFPLIFGARGQKGSQGTFDHFKGTLDEVRIYDRALNELEIKGLAGRT